MKLLVSDYDGTIFDFENIRETRKNIDAIKRFRDNDNLFAIATARTFSSIKYQTDKFKISYENLFINYCHIFRYWFNVMHQGHMYH